MQQLAAVVLVLAAAWVAAIFLRRKAGLRGTLLPRGKSRQIEILDRTRLTPQHSILLLSIRGETIVIGVHPRGFTMLCGGQRGGCGSAERV